MLDFLQKNGFQQTAYRQVSLGETGKASWGQRVPHHWRCVSIANVPLGQWHPSVRDQWGEMFF